jgi:hypothetical protein
MAKYRIVAIPPKYNLGGLFKKKNKEVLQPGAWAGSNPQLVQPGQEGFDLPEGQAAPNSEFAIQEMTPEQQAAYLKDARYQEALAGYKPSQSTYKDLARPQGNLVLAEDYEADPNKFTSAGYYPIKTESGNYEMIANKDIANLIYQKGISAQELSEKFQLGDSGELQKNFDPIYKNAAGMHAKRNKDKIDGLIKSGMTKDQAVASLVKQGEGDVQGLNSIYGSYTDAAYQKQKAEADALNAPKTTSTLTPYQKEMFAKINTDQIDADATVNTAFDNTDWSRSLTPSETTNKTAGAIYNPLTRTSEFKTSAYDKAEEAEYDVEVADKNRDLTNRKAELAKELLNNKELNEGQKQFYLNSPAAFDDLMKRHDEWKNSSTIGQSYTTASGQSVPQVGKTLNFDFNPDDKPGWSNNTKESAPSDRVDMLDKEWIQGTLGALALPGVYSGVSNLLKAAPAAAPWLSLGNASTALSIADAGTKYAPKLVKGVYEGATSDEGFTGERLKDIGYNAWKVGKEALPFTKIGKLANVKKAKDAFSLLDNSVKAAETDQSLLTSDPLSTVKNIKYMGSVAGLKKEGGEITLELSDDEIQDYIKRGYEVRETAEPKMQQGGSPSQLWYEYTGTPWSEAKAKGLTDGSMEQNLALAKRIESGEFGKPKVSAPQSQNPTSGYDDMVSNMVRQGQTLDQLVASRVGTREGLMYRFPDLFSKAPVIKSKTKTPQQLAAEQKAGKDWLIGKAKELGNEVMGSISNSFWGKAAKKVGQATLNYAIELEKKDRAAKKKQEEAKIKKVEKEVKKEVKKVNPTAIQESLKTPSVQDVLQQAGVRYQSNPLKQFTEDRTQPDFGSNLMAQVQQNQQRFGLVPTARTEQPIVNGMGSNFAQGQNIAQLQARNKVIRTTPIGSPVTEDKAEADFGTNLFAQIKQNQKRFNPSQASQLQQPIANSMAGNFAQGENIQQMQARNKAIGTSGQNLPEVPGVSIGLKQWGDSDLGNATNQILFDQQYAPKNKEEFLETPLGQNIGKGIYDWNKMENPLINPFGPADLSEDEVMQLQRKLDKEGVIDTPDNLLDSSKIKDKEIKIKPKPDKFTDVLGEVDDSYAPGNPLMSYRSQWDNSEGFRYLATPVYKDRKDQDEYKNVIGVGHFLLDASASKSKPYSHEYNKAFIKKAISNNDWVPVFKNEDGDYVRLKYKKANELSKDDKVITPLRQMKFGDLDFNNTKRPKGFQDPVREVLTKDGKGTYLIFKNKDGYSRFSGGSVVFIFKDKYDNTIVRDFAGTLNQIQKEGESIVEKYGISADELTLGYHDVGSFSAKPKTPKNGILKAKQWSSYNTDPMTGGALLIPKSK